MLILNSPTRRIRREKQRKKKRVPTKPRAAYGNTKQAKKKHQKKPREFEEDGGLGGFSVYLMKVLLGYKLSYTKIIQQLGGLSRWSNPVTQANQGWN